MDRQFEEDPVDRIAEMKIDEWKDTYCDVCDFKSLNGTSVI